MPRGPYWTTADDQRLRFLWGAGHSVAQIARKLGRTPMATYCRARRLGLDCGVPQGWEGLWAATLRSGFATTKQFRAILRWAGVAVHLSLSRPGVRSWHRHIVETDAVDEAVAKWMAAEPLERAATRRGMCSHTLRARLAKIGLLPPGGKRHFRVTDEQVARALGRAA
jgi:hypothetical protein